VVCVPLTDVLAVDFEVQEIRKDKVNTAAKTISDIILTPLLMLPSLIPDVIEQLSARHRLRL